MLHLLIKHIIAYSYFCIFFLIHLQVFFNFKYKQFSFNIFIYEKGSYAPAILLFIMTLLLVLYLMYQWSYLKKNKKKKQKLFSILVFELIIFIEAILLFVNLFLFNKNAIKNLNDDLLFIGIGVILALLMGWFLDSLMKWLFRNEIL